MKMPSNPDDPLLQALTEDAKTVAQSAAAEVRSRRRRQTNLSRSAALFVLLIVAVWFSTHSAHREPMQPISTSVPFTLPTKPPFGEAYLKVYPAEAPAEDFSQPAATKEERDLLKDIYDRPVLIVRNESGHITGVHVFESSP